MKSIGIFSAAYGRKGLEMKSTMKRAVMWLHNYGVLSEGATTWMFGAFNLRSA